MERRLIKLVVVMVLCLFPAAMAYEAYPEYEIWRKVAFAVCFYFVCLLPLRSIVRLADEDYRLGASTSDIIERWMDIVVFPIAFIVIRNYFSNNSNLLGAGPLGIIWVSFIAAITIAGLVGVIIKFFVKR
jgi:hypothetical protein